MAGTIVVDRLESDASYASSINVASPMVVSNTITMGSTAAITGNVNIDNGTLYVSQNKNTVGVGTTDPSGNIHLYASQGNEFGHLRVETTSNASLVLVRSGVQAWSMYIDNSDSSQLKIGPSNAGVALATKYFGIDTSGRVTMPSQPSFRAGLSGAWTASSGVSTIPFASESYDIGSNYNNSTYRFTAPVAGRYLFTCTLGSSGTTNQYNYFGILVFINGTNTINGWHSKERTVSSYIADSKSCILSLNANDYVEMKLEQSVTNDVSSGSFCGCLLS